MCDRFTKGSHRNISVILITPNIFHQAKNCGDISLNAKYFVILKNVRDRSQFSRLSQPVYSKQGVDLYVSYLQAASKPQGYIVLDLSQDINDLLRFRIEIFPDQNPFPLIYARIDNDTDSSTYHTLRLLKAADPKLRKAIIASCNQEILKSICE